MGLDNDARGWVMAAVSGIASIICIDVVIRQLPGKKDFRIQDSNAFLSSGLSLSFGVMIFSSLYSMLPSSKSYLQKGGMSPKAATLTMMGCFLAGAIGIAVLSQILHRYIPHSVIDCDHEHDDEEQGKAEVEDSAHHHSHSHHHETEHANGHPRVGGGHNGRSHSLYGTNDDLDLPQSLARRPSLHATISKVSQLVNGHKEFCDENGQCFGFSDPCGNECFKKALQKRPSKISLGTATAKGRIRPMGLRTQTLPHERQPLLQDSDGSSPLTPTVSGPAAIDTHPTLPSTNGRDLHKKHSHDSISSSSSSSSSSSPLSFCSSASKHSTHSQNNHQHHHHVPTNAFLSIGLQTSTAIALHKIPEGFITYATNHANPRLGVSVFLALFIHNITEGFALALPLYLAINSRWKAMFWSALLGGVSQPLGAGVAALWFRIAKRGASEGTGEPSEIVYGAMFAVTAGIMAMVSLQLLGESLDLTHSRKLCFVSAFIGMGILGLSNALTA
ncbi:hypothetical protein CC80DRAFT_512825 [Byssothecium circinans]|uniref:Zinc/iron permease n=1 Tax=Byssothecium circinans TaxID=147558 RepID=A0A6A5U9Y4_9PLEO|nr:hypothetical protein CC80DRAFT_512825 [Byssothecium circinans]